MPLPIPPPHTHTQLEDEIIHTTRVALLAVFAAQALLLAFALKLRLSSALRQQDAKLPWGGEWGRVRIRVSLSSVSEGAGRQAAMGR